MCIGSYEDKEIPPLLVPLSQFRRTVPLIKSNSASPKYPQVDALISTSETINNLLPKMDIVIGAVLTAGAKPPTLITKEMLKLMQSKSILSDVSIDQGGCFETSKPTTHDNPTYDVDNIIHYCVKNIPSAVPFTATNALNEATRPFILRLANNNGVRGDNELILMRILIL